MPFYTKLFSQLVSLIMLFADTYLPQEQNDLLTPILRQDSISFQGGHPFFAHSSNTLITPGPETSWTINLSTLTNTTSSGATDGIDDARAIIFR
jgi:hypothetical protein